METVQSAGHRLPANCTLWRWTTSIVQSYAPEAKSYLEASRCCAPSSRGSRRRYCREQIISPVRGRPPAARDEPLPLRLSVSASALRATGWVDGAANSMFLNWLAVRAKHSLLKPGSMAAVMFDTRHNSDVSNWKTLKPWSAWSERIDFEECAACSRIVGAKGYKAESKWESCDRAMGTFMIAGFLLSNLPGNISKGPSPSLRKSNFTSGCRSFSG